MNEDKKLLDLEGLQRYDGKIKEFVNNTAEANKVTPITDTEIGNLFKEDLLTQKFVSQEDIQSAINTEYQLLNRRCNLWLIQKVIHFQKN